MSNTCYLYVTKEPLILIHTVKIEGTRNNGSAAQLGSFSYQLMLIHLRHTHISSTSLPEAIFPLFHISSWYIISVYLRHNCN